MIFWLFSNEYWVSSLPYEQLLLLRAVGALLTAAILFLLLGSKSIETLKKFRLKQIIRAIGPASHVENKQNTPTMGGIPIIMVLLFSVLLWADLSNVYIGLLSIVLISYGLIGFCDDYLKVVRKSADGLFARWKYLCQSILGLLVAMFLFMYSTGPHSASLFVPGVNDFIVSLGWLYIVLSYFVIVGTSNAVNLTDGLDGLAIIPIILVGLALGVLAYFIGNPAYAYSLPYVEHAQELLVFTTAMFGAGIGFLWFNAHPARVFMGDVGSLALGAVLGCMAIVLHLELLLFIMGGIFVVETLSVMLQIFSFRVYKKRIFKMAPIHHHFELDGWSETQVVIRFWIITLLLITFGVGLLFL